MKITGAAIVDHDTLGLCLATEPDSDGIVQLLQLVRLGPPVPVYASELQPEPAEDELEAPLPPIEPAQPAAEPSGTPAEPAQPTE